MTQGEFEKKLYDNAVLVVPRVVRRASPGYFGMEYNEVILEPVTFEQMERLKKELGLM